MALRIPTDASPQVQQAFRELDDRTKNSIDVATVNSLIQQAIAKSLSSNKTSSALVNPNYPDVGDIMRPSGPSHMHGYAPDTDTSSGTEEVLHEDAKWKWPLSGGLLDASDIATTNPMRIFNLNGGLVINGPLYASAFGAGFLTSTLPGSRVSRLTSAVTVNNSTTLVDVPDMVVPVLENSNYRFFGILVFSSGTIPNFKFTITEPSALSFRFSAISDSGCIGTASSTNLATAIAVNGIGAGVNTALIFGGMLKTNTTGGQLGVQFAQNTADASDTILRTDSFIEVQQL